MSLSKVFLIGFCLVCLFLGIWRYQTIELRIKNSELRKYNDSEEEVTLIGRVVKEPEVREKSIKLTIEVTEVRPRETSRGRTSGSSEKVLVTVNRYPEYKYGDKIKIKGQLETPPVFEGFTPLNSAKGNLTGFNYKDYLKNKGIYSVIYWPKIKLYRDPVSVSDRDRVSVVYSKILDFKDKLRESIYQNISPPQSYILGAMILGDKNRMPQSLKEKLNTAGIRHITAVSGLHIVLISSILMSLLIGLGFWRGQAFYLAIVFLALFIAMTGFQASSIRAGIMGGLFLLGQKIGRKSVSSRAILMAAGIMLAVNPFLLKDIGFQLSFLAAWGIISLAPIFKKWLRSDILAMTFSAYLFTLPILIYNFGRVSLVAPITNVLILPFVQWIMIFGFIFGLTGMLWSGLGWILSFPCWFLLTYSVKIVDFFSGPWAARSLGNIHWLWLIISYLILAFLTWCLNKRERLKFLNY